MLWFVEHQLAISIVVGLIVGLVCVSLVDLAEANHAVFIWFLIAAFVALGMQPWAMPMKTYFRSLKKFEYEEDPHGYGYLLHCLLPPLVFMLPFFVGRVSGA